LSTSFALDPLIALHPDEALIPLWTFITDWACCSGKSLEAAFSNFALRSLISGCSNIALEPTNSLCSGNGTAVYSLESTNSLISLRASCPESALWTLWSGVAFDSSRRKDDTGSLNTLSTVKSHLLSVFDEFARFWVVNASYNNILSEGIGDWPGRSNSSLIALEAPFALHSNKPLRSSYGISGKPLEATLSLNPLCSGNRVSGEALQAANALITLWTDFASRSGNANGTLCPSDRVTSEALEPAFSDFTLITLCANLTNISLEASCSDIALEAANALCSGDGLSGEALQAANALIALCANFASGSDLPLIALETALPLHALCASYSAAIDPLKTPDPLRACWAYIALKALRSGRSGALRSDKPLGTSFTLYALISLHPDEALISLRAFITDWSGGSGKSLKTTLASHSLCPSRPIYPRCALCSSSSVTALRTRDATLSYQLNHAVAGEVVDVFRDAVVNCRVDW
jgi:hypothetical protein